MSKHGQAFNCSKEVVKLVVQWKIAKNLIVVAMLMSWFPAGMAEIYKYQDEKGRWHYTDKDPEKKSKKLVSYKTENGADATGLDLKKTLMEKYKPGNPVEAATLSVVMVKTNMGSGSGFFVSDDCYIVTNKHVIRPTTTKSWKKSEEELKKEKAEIKEAHQYIADEKERLKINSRKLTQYKAYISRLPPGEEKKNEEIEYRYVLNEYNKDKEALDKKIVETKDREKEYKGMKSDFSMDSSISRLSRSFKIVLKDNTTLQASLVKLASDEDLALLKVDKCKSPYLAMDTSTHPYQGMKIFAVGSPLGLKDHVTSGIVTNVREDYINTDAKILPGNSGGPMITSKGEVIGINTLKVSMENTNTEGFGMAIPVNRVMKNFGQYVH